MLSSRTSAQPLWHDERLEESDDDAAIAMQGSARSGAVDDVGGSTTIGGETTVKLIKLRLIT